MGQAQKAGGACLAISGQHAGVHPPCSHLAHRKVGQAGLRHQHLLLLLGALPVLIAAPAVCLLSPKHRASAAGWQAESII